jgi:hypothetical protein
LRVVVPYVHGRLLRATVDSVQEHLPGASYRDVGGSETAYHDLLAELWVQPEDTIVVEHDIEVHERVLGSFEGCTGWWCTLPYQGPSGPLTENLGCVRWRAELMRDEPDLLTAIASDANSVPARSWRRLDVRLLTELKRRGYDPHAHSDPVRHLHRYPGG